MKDFNDEEWFEWISVMNVIEMEKEERALAELDDDLDEEEEEDDWYEEYEDYEYFADEEMEEDEIIGREVKRLEKMSGHRWTNAQRFLCELLLASGMGKIETIIITNRMEKKQEHLSELINFVFNDDRYRSREEIYKKLKEMG